MNPTIQPYIDRLEELREWMDVWIDIKVWMDNPLKPTPWKSFNKIWEKKAPKQSGEIHVNPQPRNK